VAFTSFASTMTRPDAPAFGAGRENGADLRDNRLPGDMLHLRMVWALGDLPGSLP